MNNPWTRVLLALLVLFGIIFVLLRFVPSKEEKLAEVLGVKDELSRYIRGFPILYFDEKLDPGISMQEVHKIVKGYEVMYDCGIDEVYYFYSTSQRKALRIMVSYGYNEEDVEREYKEGKGWVNILEEEDLYYMYIRGEDDDSWMLGVDGCEMIMPED